MIVRKYFDDWIFERNQEKLREVQSRRSRRESDETLFAQNLLQLFPSPFRDFQLAALTVGLRICSNGRTRNRADRVAARRSRARFSATPRTVDTFCCFLVRFCSATWICRRVWRQNRIFFFCFLFFQYNLISLRRILIDCALFFLYIWSTI